MAVIKIFWFEPVGWFLLGHVNGINFASTTCQPRPANHDLWVSLGFEVIKIDLLCLNMYQHEKIKNVLMWKLIFYSQSR